MFAQAEAIADFAAALRELRNSVGNPPFREMSGRSGAISHTTLHEATKGNKLPSWGTTAEFVKACGADPADYRERWEAANQAVRAAGAGTPATDEDASVEGSSGDDPTLRVDDEASAEVETVREGRGRSRLARPAAAALATAAVGVGTIALVVVAIDRVSGSGGDGSKPSGGKGALSAEDCPMRISTPPSAPPLRKGDMARFIADITLPDCSRVGTGKTVTKIWRFKNVGTVPWSGYSLRRLDLPQQADQCQTISDVPIDDTLPGKMVDIRTIVTTPKRPGLCYVRFKMVDSSGRVVFPGGRPVNFQIIVEQQ